MIMIYNPPLVKGDLSKVDTFRCSVFFNGSGLELEKDIQPLTRSEKLQLIAAITRMLQEEERSLSGLPLQPDVEYPVYTPLDSGMYEAAAQLQAYVDEGKL
jgi:hypothetical protein